MGTMSPEFKGRQRRPSAALPPGQYPVQDFPVLAAGPTPTIDHGDWELTSPTNPATSNTGTGTACALADPLPGLIGPDVSAAIGRCTACGRTAPMAQAQVFDHAPGLVARCPVCDQVLLRLVRGPGVPGQTCTA